MTAGFIENVSTDANSYNCHTTVIEIDVTDETDHHIKFEVEAADIGADPEAETAATNSAGIVVSLLLAYLKLMPNATRRIGKLTKNMDSLMAMLSGRMIQPK